MSGGGGGLGRVLEVREAFCQFFAYTSFKLIYTQFIIKLSSKLIKNDNSEFALKTGSTFI